MFKRLVASFALVAMLASTCFSVPAYAETKLPEQPSPWAGLEVYMSSVEDLGEATSYVNYTSPVQDAQLDVMESDFESRFNYSSADLAFDNEDGVDLTRGQVVKELYAVIQASLKGEYKNEEDSALNYFVENKLIYGNGQDYALDNICTVQEMILLAHRTYTHVVYGNEDESKGAFWKINDGDNTVYLLGSIHVSDGKLYPMQKEIMKGFVNSDALVVECNVASMTAEVQAQVQQIMMLSDGTKLEDHVSAETFEQFVALGAKAGLTRDMCNMYKPWAASNIVSSINMALSGKDSSRGVDMYLMNLASVFQKDIEELETVMLQMNMFDSFSNELQEMNLKASLANESNDEILDNMLQAWHEGDLEKLQTSLNNENANASATEEEKALAAEFNQKLLTDRNPGMIEKVKEMLAESDKDYFVVAGTLHMVGDDGIVKVLEDAGYTVERIK